MATDNPQLLREFQRLEYEMLLAVVKRKQLLDEAFGESCSTEAERQCYAQKWREEIRKLQQESNAFAQRKEALLQRHREGHPSS